MRSRRQERVASALYDLAAEEPVSVVVRGHSMTPLIEDGVRVDISRGTRYLPGDVIAFRREDDQLSVHRVLGLRPSRHGWRFVTRGDAARALDPPLERERILGRVVGGDCSPRVYDVPVGDRARALARLVAAAARKLVGR